MLAIPAALLLVGCEVEWGGAEVSLVDPMPPPPEAATEPAEALTVHPLPEGPLLYLVRPGPQGELGMALPVARWTAEGLDTLGIPAAADSSYLARFDSAFLAPGDELVLEAGARRVGSAVLGRGRLELPVGCPPASAAAVLLRPGSVAPPLAFAHPASAAADPAAEDDPSAADPAAEDDPTAAGGPAPARYAPLEPDNRMVVFGPILAEQLLREEGFDRPYLAQLAALSAVAWPGDPAPAMAATYLVGDALGAPPPEGEAISLFFLARWDSAGQRYVPEWSEFRRYDEPGEREIFTYLEGIRSPAGRIDFLVRSGADDRRLVASIRRERDDREIDWEQPAGCPLPGIVETPPPAGSRG